VVRHPVGARDLLPVPDHSDRFSRPPSLVFNKHLEISPEVEKEDYTRSSFPAEPLLSSGNLSVSVGAQEHLHE
jgi:hypothetical protein